MEFDGKPPILSVMRNRILRAGLVAAHRRRARFDCRNRRNRRLFSENRKAFEDCGGRFVESFAAGKNRIVESNGDCFGWIECQYSTDRSICGEFSRTAARANALVIAAAVKEPATRRSGESTEFRRNGLLLRRGDEKGDGLFAARKRRRALLAARRAAADSAAGKTNRQSLSEKPDSFRVHILPVSLEYLQNHLRDIVVSLFL